MTLGTSRYIQVHPVFVTLMILGTPGTHIYEFERGMKILLGLVLKILLYKQKDYDLL